jgi:hypothetical protein
MTLSLESLSSLDSLKPMFILLWMLSQFRNSAFFPYFRAHTASIFGGKVRCFGNYVVFIGLGMDHVRTSSCKFL